MNKLKASQNRKSTQNNYLGIWRNFNNFLIKLDFMPRSWEDRTSLFLTYLVDNGLQSSTLKSYASAIKKVLILDDYEWNYSKVLLGALTKSCKLINDSVRTRLPIQFKLLELILFEVQHKFTIEKNQPYLKVLYMTIIALAYYGLLRIGELTTGSHPIKAKDVHVADNKEKILIVLYSSKTHGCESRPQKVWITGANDQDVRDRKFKGFFCPFNLTRKFMSMRGNFSSDNEPFFIFRDKSPVKPCNVRTILKQSLEHLNLDQDLYDCHSLRIGRATDLLKLQYSLEEIKFCGRWRSNAVYKYLRT